MANKTLNFLEALEANEAHDVLCMDNRAYFPKGTMMDESKHEHWGLKPILSEWQIVEPTVTITKSEFAKVWDRCIAGVSCKPSGSHASHIFNEVCKELGMG